MSCCQSRLLRARPRHLQCCDRAALAQADLGHHALEAGPGHPARGRAAEIIVDRLDLGPAERQKPIPHGVLQSTALTVVLATNNDVSRLFDHLMDANHRPKPRMPGILHLACLGPVGVPSSRCTMCTVRIPPSPDNHRSAGSPSTTCLVTTTSCFDDGRWFMISKEGGSWLILSMWRTARCCLAYGAPGGASISTATPSGPPWVLFLS
jgi:hypothetical protein